VKDNIRRLKHSGAQRFPFTDIDANRAWLAVGCFADGLVRWFQQLCLIGALAIAEPKTLRWELWAHPGPHRAAGPSTRGAHPRRLAGTDALLGRTGASHC